MADPIPLDVWLGRCYGATKALAPADSQARFSAAIQEDSGLRAEAERRLADLEALEQSCQGDVGKRCALSAAYLKALRLALGT
jgi:hypothetical protein